MNRENFKLLLDQIERDPEHWGLSNGNRHSTLEWVQILSGRLPLNETAVRDAAEWLEINDSQAITLIVVTTVDELRSFYEHDKIPKLSFVAPSRKKQRRREERRSELVFFCFNTRITLRIDRPASGYVLAEVSLDPGTPTSATSTLSLNLKRHQRLADDL